MDKQQALKLIIDDVKLYIMHSGPYRPFIEDPFFVHFIIEDWEEYGDSKVAWTSLNENVHIVGIHIDNWLDSQFQDTLIYQAIVHELVHVNQYRRFFGLGKFWTRTFGRLFDEKKAKIIGESAERWIAKNHNQCLSERSG